jgi:hypothetical protein
MATIFSGFIHIFFSFDEFKLNDNITANLSDILRATIRYTGVEL